MATTDFGSVDEYIASFPEDVQEILQRVRQTIRAVVPDAGEKISYQMPTFTLDGKNLVHFSGWKKHISIYPIPPLDDVPAKEIEPYKSGEGTLKFPLNKPIPYDLIGRLAEAFLASRTQ
ncbi:iron chaperone [Kribbella sancticallisti]